MNLKQKLAVAATGLVGMGLGSLTLGVAHAQTLHSNPAASAPAGPNTDTQVGQQGNSGGPDTATSAEKAATEGDTGAASVEADGPGGHQDPNGANVQYQGQDGADPVGSAGTGR